MPTVELHPPREWPTLGRQLVSWMEYHLPHGPGDVQGQPLWICDEAAQFVLDCYRLYPHDHKLWAGRRVVEYGLLSEPKGFAKSELAAALVVAEFVGPCRFDHWAKKGEVSSWGYAYAEGEPVGKPMTYPFIRILATEEGQTGNTYKVVYAMLRHAQDKYGNCPAGRFMDADVSITRTLLGQGGEDGEIRPCSAGAASKDGGLESFAVADEPHLYILPVHHEMHDIVKNNSVKRAIAEPWMLATTTMFRPGQGSVAEDLYRDVEELVKVPEKKRRSYETCYFHREGFPVAPDAGDDELLPALMEAYQPVLDHMDLHRIMRRMRAPGASWANGVRFFINRQHQGDDKAFDPAKWDNQAAPARNNITGEPVVLWFDGSDKGQGNDHTVLGAWTLDPLPHCVLIETWQPEKNHEGEYKINRAKVRQKVTEVRQELDVVLFVCDPHKWAEQIDDWAEEFGEYSPDEPILVSFDTSKNTLMGPAVDRIRELHDEEAFTHDGSELLRWYALNAMLADVKGSGSYHALVKEKHALKIDAIVGATIGLPYLDKAREMVGSRTGFMGAYL